MSVPGAGFAVTSGEPELGGGEGPNRHFFCPRCKNWMFMRLRGLDVVNVRPTMLDEHRWFAPYIEIFAAQRLPWAATSAVHSFAAQPDPEGYAALVEAFAREGARPG